MQFDRRQPVAAAQQVARDLRRARIKPQRLGRVERRHDPEIGREQGFRRLRQLGLRQFGDTVAPFAGLLRFFGRQVVKAGAGMGVDHPERFVLALEIVEDARQHRVFDHVGEIARVIAVAVVHTLNPSS
jgi:hypothetical protein